MVRGGKIRRRFGRWLDECKMAISGIILATREPKFLIPALISFVVLAHCSTYFLVARRRSTYSGRPICPGKLAIIGNAFLAIFGVGRNFWDWILLFLITVLQSILIGLVILVWQKRRRSKKDQVVATAQNADNVQSAGLAAGLAILGSGCPTCGTTLLMPLIGTLLVPAAICLLVLFRAF